MGELGVLHPASILAGLLAASTVGYQSASNEACRLVLRLVEANPALLATRLNSGLQEAVQLGIRHAKPGSVVNDSWRFASFRAAYAEHLDSRHLREQFIDAIVTDFNLMAMPVLHGSFPTGLSLVSYAELLTGIVVRLPFRSEFELARILSGTVQLFELRATPLLLNCEGDIGNAGIQQQGNMLGICTAAAVLHTLCKHWVGNHPELKRLFTIGPDGCGDQPLPVGFARNRMPDFTALFHKLAAASNDSKLLFKLLVEYLDDGCPFWEVAASRARKKRGVARVASGSERAAGRRKVQVSK